PPPEKKSLLPVALLLGLVATALLFALGGWFFLRRARGEAAPVADPQAEPAALEESPSTIVFSCAGCGNRIRPRGERAGRRAKCPQGGEAVLIPGGRGASAP